MCRARAPWSRDGRQSDLLDLIFAYLLEASSSNEPGRNLIAVASRFQVDSNECEISSTHSCGVMPAAFNVEICQRALDSSPELQNGSAPTARHVVSVLATGVLPSQALCVEARREVEELRQAYREAEASNDAVRPAAQHR